MKLVLITVVKDFQNDILKLLKEANIENFSESSIEGFKKTQNSLSVSNWFSGQESGIESTLFFSFTDEKNIDVLFKGIQKFNNHININSSARAVVIPIEKFI